VAEPREVHAIVSHNGRPDLTSSLSRVRAATLLIVGGKNRPVRALNERACLRLGATRRLEIVPGTSYGLDEPEALEDICRLATKLVPRPLQGRRTRDRSRLTQWFFTTVGGDTVE